MKSKNTITIDKAAELLNISTATVRNWIRSGLLLKKINGVDKNSFDKLAKGINSGKTNRLNSRANKKTSQRTFIPEELLAKNTPEKNITNLIYLIKKNHFDIEIFITELLKHKKNNRSSINSDISTFIKDNRYILKIEPEVLYQSLRSEGNKSKDGSFFTPGEIVKDIIKDLKISKDFKICDPCCGTGNFLKEVNNKYKNIHIYGNDIDPTAINIAEYYLSENKRNKFTFEISDSLKIIEKDEYDLIITNPPWGAHYSKPERKILDKIFPEADSGDSLEYFLLKGFFSLKENGIMSFVLPESFLYVKRFGNIRKFFLENSNILKIKIYGKIFIRVFSGIIRIDIQKSKIRHDHKITIETDQKIKQSCFLDEFDYQFNVNTAKKDRAILNNIFSNPFITLKNNAQWSLGIVTGDNAKFVSSEETKEHTIPLITGKDIDYFTIKDHIKYLSHNFDKLQQVPKNNFYEVKEKLVYKFISNKLVFAYDNTGKYTLNSANILIPELKDYPIKVVMAILNSDLMNFIYQKKFKSLKVLRSSLEKLPFPKHPDKDIIREIELNINKILKGEKFSENILNKLVDQLFNISHF
ncbi:MAG: N-6 DNA methylase [Candidatus Delongbacteria bacterium]|nr:N-6 DNA methylase [Candidatus Delongbacteria bacterium]